MEKIWKVDKIIGKTENWNCKIILDINSEIYPMKKTFYSIVLSKSLIIDGTPSQNNFCIHIKRYFNR